MPLDIKLWSTFGNSMLGFVAETISRKVEVFIPKFPAAPT